MPGGATIIPPFLAEEAGTDGLRTQPAVMEPGSTAPVQWDLRAHPLQCSLCGPVHRGRAEGMTVLWAEHACRLATWSQGSELKSDESPRP